MRLEAWLGEDAPDGDLTTDLLDIAAVPGRITFAARSGMGPARVEVAAALRERGRASA